MKKLLVYTLIVVVVFLGGGFLSYRAYKSARQSRLIQQAKTYLSKPNEKKALLCVQRALRYNPKDVEACRLMAQLAERGRSPAAFVWRSKVVELNPRSLDDRLALAQCAITFHDYASATNALEGIDAAGKKTPAYHNLAGAVAAAGGQTAQAEAHFLEAVRLDPQNAFPQLNLAVVRLLSTNQPILAEAHASLDRISANPTNASLRCQALRELAKYAALTRQTNTVLALSRKLVLETNSVFADRLLRLSVLQDAQDAGFQSTLTEFQREAVADPTKVYDLAVWQMAKISPTQTLTWLTNLPPDCRTNQAVAMVTADCFSVLQDWRGLQASLDKQYWAELEFVRHALKSRALRGQELTAAAKGEWELAMKTANSQKAALIMLLRVTASWRWQSEAEDLLWNIVNRFPEERWAFATLSQALYAGGRTRPLMMLFTQQNKRLPADLNTKNNLAMTALLLEASEVKPHDLARETYQQAPTNSSFASTYAFSLYLQGKNAEALKVIQGLKSQELEQPSIAGYYGLILKASGDSAKAKSCFALASKSRLLPEEQKLFERAQAGS